MPFDEVNIEDGPAPEGLVLRANCGRREVPTIKVRNRYFACSPFRARKLAAELQIPLND